MKIKLRTVDRHFSNCIRERVDWTCERCGSYKPEGRRQGLHCSHFHGRGAWSTRLDPSNCEALCYGCHSHLEQHPYKHTERQREIMGEVGFYLLLERSIDTQFGRSIKKAEAEASKHFREEYKRMQRLRLEGTMGRIEFTPFNPNGPFLRVVED